MNSGIVTGIGAGPALTLGGSLPAAIATQLGSAYTNGFYYSSVVFSDGSGFDNCMVIFAGNSSANVRTGESDMGRGNFWYNCDFFLPPPGLWYPQGNTHSACLIDPRPSSVAPYLAYDDFSNTYTVNGTDAITAVGGDGTVACQWTGSGWTMKYNSTGPNAYKWTITDGSTTWVKASPQSDPTGSYSDGMTTVTVA